MSHRKKFMGIGHPNITAAFQKICGINIRQDAGAKECVDPVVRSSQHATNGTVSNGFADHCVTGKSSNVGNSKSLPNGCDSLLKTAGKNGHNKDVRKRLQSQSNDHNSSVGDESSKNHKLHVKNGCTGEKGKVLNGIKSNGTSFHPTHSSQNLGNGHSNQITTEETHCPDYSIDNYLLYYIFSFGASLGNEVFYILFYSCSLWNLDGYVGRKVLIFWCTVMYIGQAAKDIIRWPRPDSPPVARLEKRYELEYGMPSTHAMVGVAIPFGMLYFMLSRYEVHLLFGILFCTNWSILVSISRLYLGMHSALDIIAGLLFAFLLMAMSLPFVDYVDIFVMSHPYAVPCVIGVGISMCLLYPSLDQWSTARGDTTLSVAVFSGIYVGLWLTRNQFDNVSGPDTAVYTLQFPDLDVLFMSVIREVVGVFVVVSVLTVSKFIMLHSLCKVFGFDPKKPESKQNLIIELPYKYISYFLGSFSATYFVPLLFVYLNIQRPNFYSELITDSVPWF